MTAASRMRERRAARVERAIKEFGEAQFAAGEWHRDESEEPWDDVYAAVILARLRLSRAIAALMR